MVQLALPKNSRVQKGRHFAAPAGAKNVKTFRIYRYDPEGTENPRWDTYDVAPWNLYNVIWWGQKWVRGGMS